jgi:hypothetical protein
MIRLRATKLAGSVIGSAGVPPGVDGRLGVGGAFGYRYIQACRM